MIPPMCCIDTNRQRNATTTTTTLSKSGFVFRFCDSRTHRLKRICQSVLFLIHFNSIYVCVQCVTSVSCFVRALNDSHSQLASSKLIFILLFLSFGRYSFVAPTKSEISFWFAVSCLLSLTPPIFRSSLFGIILVVGSLELITRVWININLLAVSVSSLLSLSVSYVRWLISNACHVRNCRMNDQSHDLWYFIPKHIPRSISLCSLDSSVDFSSCLGYDWKNGN